MEAYIASVPLHIISAIWTLKIDKVKECDLYYVPTSNNAKELTDTIRKLGVFKNVILLPNINIEYPITLKQGWDISLRRFAVRKILKNKKYSRVYYGTDGWLLNSIIYSSFKIKPKQNIFVENGVNPYLVSYDSKPWYLRAFINCSFMVCMDGRFIDKRYLFEPSLMQVRQSGEICRLEKIDKSDEKLRAVLNKIYGYDEKLDSFEKKDIIIMEQGPRKEPIDMLGLWTKVKRYIPLDRAIVKSHPRQKDSILRELGFDIYERYVIPWEEISLNQDMNHKTLLCIFSTSCVYPKLMYDDEPRVIMLYKLIGIDYSFFGEGMIKFVEGVGSLYKDKSKFFIPETWEEFEQYIKKEMLCTITSAGDFTIP